MKKLRTIGKSIPRKEGREKVTGGLKYVNDSNFPGLLHAVLKTSSHSHAEIISIDTSEAIIAPGVRAVVTGIDLPYYLGLYLGDKTPLAIGRVRHYGEAVAAVIADSEAEAKYAADKIKVVYKQLPIVKSPREALKADATIIHEKMEGYRHIPAILPEAGSNVANRTKIRKGNIEEGFLASEVIIEEEFSFPPGDHVAMEPRVTIAKIESNGQVILHSATQAPFVVRSLMSSFFNIPPGKITVITPSIGGGFGGKAGIQLEALAYLLSKRVGGRPVKLVNTRESDMVSSPGHIGLEAKVKLGSNRKGKLMAAELTFLFDSGAYADYAVNISRAAAIACTGPYSIPNLWCDSLCVYTNHPFATAYRGFGHIELAFAIERGMDILAEKLRLDPKELRLINSIQRGDTSPTQSIMDENTGDLKACINRVAELINWQEGQKIYINDNKVRAKGLSCLWKAPAMPTNTDAGVILTFNEDGSVNLQSGITEIGQATKSALAQIVAEKLGIETDLIHIVMEVNTQTAPHDWATAASRSLMMAGRAAIEAAEDAIDQLKNTASQVLRCPRSDLAVGGGRVYIADEPQIGLLVKDLALGYVYSNGNGIGGQIIGRGRYISRRLTGIDPETGKGHPALEWTLGAEAVEVEVDLLDYTYRIIKAACVMDVGKVINPQIARGQIVGAMAMALGYSSCEGFIFNSREQVLNDDLRSYKVFRYGDEPEYLVDFIETPQGDGPYGARGLGEQGVIGIPGALSNALSKAIDYQLKTMPLTAESMWRAKKEGKQ